MGALLHFVCKNCQIGCPLLPLNVEQLAIIKKEDKEIYDKFMNFEIMFMFCQREDYFLMIVINSNGREEGAIL